MGRTSKAKQLSEAVTASSFLTEREVKLAAVIRKQTRDIAYLLFDGSALIDEVSVDDEEIENHYVLNIDSYETEEQFSFGYVTISSTGNAQDFGDLTARTERIGGGQISDSHGGLGGY